MGEHRHPAPCRQRLQPRLMVQTMRELDSRFSDGILVRLLWDEEDGRVAVAVEDTKIRERFVVDVRDGENALDVFKHPYAYAAWVAA